MTHCLFLGLSSDVSWADVVSVTLASCSLVTAYRVFRLQRRLSTEQARLSCTVVDDILKDGSHRSRVEVTFHNVGTIALTLEQLGLKTIGGSPDLLAPKWEGNRTNLPARLQPGEKAFATYFADEVELEPRHTGVIAAVAVTQGGKTFIKKGSFAHRWARIATNVKRSTSL